LRETEDISACQAGDTKADWVVMGLHSRHICRARVLLCLLCGFIALALAPIAHALEDGRIGVLYVGCMLRSRPFWDMRYDPLFSMSFVQATLRDLAAFGPAQQAAGESAVYRLVRLYMPRTYQQMASRFDVIVLSNANREAVGPSNIEMLARGVREKGMGLFMGGGWESFGGSFARPSWGDTSIGELLPTNVVTDTWVEYPRYGIFLVVTGLDHEFVGSLSWNKRLSFMTNCHHNLVTPKPGAEVLAHIESMGYRDHPAMIDWEVGNGTRVFAYTSEIAFFYMDEPWEYAIDFGCNLMIYLNRRPVPQDMNLVHSLRSKMQEVSMEKSLLLTLLEFCDRFGANTAKIILKIDELDRMASSARPLYLQLRFEETLDTYRQVDEALGKLEGEAMKLKDRTLRWVYVIEWLAVTGTALICAFVLWSTMVRRRLYREVRTTRLVDQVAAQ